MDRIAGLIAARGRLALLLGLAAGLGLPQLADAMRPAIWPLVITLLFLSVLRIGPRALQPPRNNLRRIATLTLVLQVGCPLAAFVVFAAVGLQGSPWAQALVLILAAAPITGAAPITALAGGVPDLALRQTMLGTLALPLTALPIFMLIPAFGTVALIAKAALVLLLAIGCATAAGLIVRRALRTIPTPSFHTRLDALTAVVMGLVVVGLMSAAAEAVRETPEHFFAIMTLVFVINFALQAAACLLWPDTIEKTAVAVVAGNRNAALFLGVLPAAISPELLLVIGCYQVPMYLTPFFLPWIRSRMARVALPRN